jgi:hypothetical protein
METDTIVNIAGVMLTATVIILNFFILRNSIRQNRKSIALYEENLKLSEESILLNRSLLEENKNLIIRQELDNRPKFRMMPEGFRFDAVSGKPQLYMENIGGKGAFVKTARVVLTKNTTSIVKDVKVERSVKPGAPLNVVVDLPATVISYEVKRKDGLPIGNTEIILLSADAVVEYTHIDDAGKAVDPFTDALCTKIGKDYLNNSDYQCVRIPRPSTSHDTWYSLLGTGTGLSSASEDSIF